jgi:hypothetical protein
MRGKAGAEGSFPLNRGEVNCGNGNLQNALIVRLVAKTPFLRSFGIKGLGVNHSRSLSLKELRVKSLFLNKLGALARGQASPETGERPVCFREFPGDIGEGQRGPSYSVVKELGSCVGQFRSEQ